MRMWCVVTLMLLAGQVLAQPGNAPPPDARWGREQIETVIIGKYSSELNLSPEQAERFFPRFRQFQNQAEALQRGLVEQRQEMDQLSQDPNADKGKVGRVLSEQTLHAQRIADAKQQFLTDVSAFLTPQQVSRCSILLDELPRRMHQYIEERRRGQDTAPGFSPRPVPQREKARPRRRGY